MRCDGADVLRLEDEDSAEGPGEAPLRKTFDLEELERMLAERMLVAPDVPRVSYVSFAVQGRETVAVPLGWTLRRH